MSVLASYTFKSPVELGEGITPVTVMNFGREPTAEDMEDLPMGRLKHGDYQMLMSRITDCPLTVIKKIKARDYIPCVRIVDDFLLDGPIIGEIGSEK